MLDELDATANVSGQISLYRVNFSRKDRRHPRVPEFLFTQKNQIQYGWGAVVALLLSGQQQYRVNTIYLEYENVANPTDTVTAPTYGRDEGVGYFTDLAMSGSRDFIRAPLLVNPTIGVSAGYQDYFPPGSAGNLLTFHTQSQGSVGHHGKPFSNAANSKVYGLALVAAPESGDATKDIVFARTYFSTADQTLKLPSSQIGVTWELAFK